MGQSFGIVYIATENYVSLAKMSAGSLIYPDINVVIERAESTEDAFRKRLSLPQWTPFDHTLYLDCDIIQVDPEAIESLVETCKFRLSITMAAWQIANIQWLWPATWIRQLGGFDAVSMLSSNVLVPNSGMIYVRKGDFANQFFEDWRRNWEIAQLANPDELALIEPAFIRGCALGGSFSFSQMEPWIHVPNWAVFNPDLSTPKRVGFIHCFGPNKAEEMCKAVEWRDSRL